LKLGPYELGPNDTPENGIYCGDARELAKAIPDESVDLIFTDPVYWQIDDYRWLAETGARVLKQDRWCLCYYGIGFLPETVGAMGLYLAYNWHHVDYMPTLNARGAYRTFSNYRGLLRYRKGNAKPLCHIRDLHTDTYDSRNSGHKWAKNLNVVGDYLRTFAAGAAITIDPFSGGGTTPVTCKLQGIPYLAFEIDPDTCAMARERVRNTQPPLFIAELEQLQMDIRSQT